MIIPIRTLGDPVLKTPAKPVEDFDDALRRLAQDMFETMYDAPGVGLAGPQVGISLRLFVFDDGETGPDVHGEPRAVGGGGRGRWRRRAACRSPVRSTRRAAPRGSPAGARTSHGEPVEIDGRGAPGADLPARDRPPGRNAVHRPARRGGPRGRAGRAPPDRARARRAARATPRRRGVSGDARARSVRVVFLGNDAWSVPTLERSPAATTSTWSWWSRTRPARGARVRAHADTGRGRRSRSGAARSTRSETTRDDAGSWTARVHSRPTSSVVVAYGELLCRRRAGAPALGSVNLHFSLLPAMARGESGAARDPRRATPSRASP